MEGPTYNAALPVLILQRTTDNFGQFEFIRQSAYPVYFSRSCYCGLYSMSISIYSHTAAPIFKMIYYNATCSFHLLINMRDSGVLKIFNSCSCKGVYTDVAFVDVTVLNCMTFLDFDRGRFHRVSDRRWALPRCYLSKLVARGNPVDFDWASVIRTVCPGGKVSIILIFLSYFILFYLIYMYRFIYIYMHIYT